jgi:23S rRNA pseudouridine1911/1915/1917 synthase
VTVASDDDTEVLDELEEGADNDENDDDDDDDDIFLTNDDGVLTASGKYTKDIVAAASSSLDLPETPEAAKASPKTLRPGVVHRLDKGTSGVLIAAKHNEAVAKLSNLFARRDITKIYLA